MALTNSGIREVKKANEYFKTTIAEISGLASSIQSGLQMDKEFMKYVTDTASGSALYSELMALIENLMRTQKISNSLQERIESFLNFQQKINSGQ